MKRKFLTNLALLIFLNLLIKPFFVFGIDRTVQNVVGASEYGHYFSLLSLSFVLNILLDVGITNFNNKNIAQHSQLLSKYLSSIVPLKFILSLIYAVICITTGLLLGYGTSEMKLLLVLIVNQFLASFILYLRSNISGLHLFRIDSLMSVLDRTIMIILCSFLLWGNIISTSFRIEHYVYAQTIAYSLTAFTAFFIVLYRAKRFRVRFDLSFFVAILKQSYPYALLILLMAAYNRIDAVMLERMLLHGKEQAGIYAQSFRILDTLNNYGLLFTVLLLPIFSRMIKQKQQINQMLQLSYLLLIVPAIIISVSSYFYREEIICLLYPDTFYEVSPSIFGILMLSFIGHSTTYIFGTLLTANGSLKELNLMALSGVCINVLLNFLLIPWLQAYGSALSSLCTQVFASLAQIIIAVRIFRLHINIKIITRLLTFVIIVAVMGRLASKYEITWYYGYIGLVITGFIFAVIIKILNIKALLNILRFGDLDEPV